MGKLDSIAPLPTFGWMVDVMGRYDPCSSFAVSPNRCTDTRAFLTNEDVAGQRVNQNMSTAVSGAVRAIEPSPIRCAQTVTMAHDSLSRSTPETFAAVLAHRHTAQASRTLVSRHIEHTSGVIKVPIVALEEARLFELKPRESEVRLIAPTATAALRAVSGRETVLLTALDTMKGDV
jgi:hypothetical protein